ncbi:hypothetical protein V491_03220, partial [Pseudogymnoascus sp. VKM F-3775]
DVDDASDEDDGDRSFWFRSLMQSAVLPVPLHEKPKGQHRIAGWATEEGGVGGKSDTTCAAGTTEVGGKSGAGAEVIICSAFC